MEPSQLNDKTAISVGLFATILAACIKFVSWLTGIKKDVDKHTLQLIALEGKVDETNENQSLFMERMARFEEQQKFTNEKIGEIHHWIKKKK